MSLAEDRKTSRARDISYTAFDPSGQEILRLTFAPGSVLADGRPLDKSQWTFGDYRGVPNVLIINRAAARDIHVLGVPEPASLLLLGSATAMLLLWRFWRASSPAGK